MLTARNTAYNLLEMTLYAKDYRTEANISRLTENVCMCAIHFLRCLILQLTSFTTSFPDVPTVRSMYTYCNDDLRKSSRVVFLKRRVICLLNLHNVLENYANITQSL